MYLTDNLSVPTMWQLPVPTAVPARGHLLIWADDDISDAGLHANFKLDADGEEIGLFDHDGITLIDSIVYPEQTTNISYGRYPDASEELRFFPSPTPGSANSDAYLGEVESLKFSHHRGFYNQSFFGIYTLNICE